MCRFIAYLGTPIIVDELLLKPSNSLIHQSFDAGEMPEPLNGDGFGLGWYDLQVRELPGLFRSITPAWNNHNLLYNAAMFRAHCIFAHVRAASEGLVSEVNSHPFPYGKYLMMHNGGVPLFSLIKRPLLHLLDDDLFLWINGQTDSEHIFALLLQKIRDLTGTGNPVTIEQMKQCFQSTFDIIQALKVEAGTGDKVSTFNLMVTDGKRIFGTRFSSRPEAESRTLYYSQGSHFECVNGASRMVQDDSNSKAVLIVSEKLNKFENDWVPIPANHFIAVDSTLEVHLHPMSH